MYHFYGDLKCPLHLHRTECPAQSSECSCFVFQNHTDLEQHEEMTEMSFWVNYPFKLHACLIKNDICVSNLMAFLLRSVSCEERQSISLVLLLVRLLRLLLLLLFAGFHGYCCRGLHSRLRGQQPAGKL